MLDIVFSDEYGNWHTVNAVAINKKSILVLGMQVFTLFLYVVICNLNNVSSGSAD